MGIKIMWSLIKDEKFIDNSNMNIHGTNRVLSYTNAVKEAIIQAMNINPQIYCMGQGINDIGGYWGITKGLCEKFGEKRIFDIPLSENGMMGIAIGSAINGMRPIFFHNRPDFLWLTMDQLINHGTKFNYMSGGQCAVPLVVWAATGKGWGSAAQHTQALQSIFMHIPGCKIVMPTTPYDAKGLMLSAIIDNNPVIILEHRLLLNQDGHVPEDSYKIPFGKGIVRKEGSDVTLLGISLMAKEVEKAAKMLEGNGINAEIIDLRTIKPWDVELVCSSVRKTGRLVIADTSWRTCGVSAEIAATIYEREFRNLKTPIVRLGNIDVPAPASYPLEEAFYVNADKIYNAVISLF